MSRERLDLRFSKAGNHHKLVGQAAHMAWDIIHGTRLAFREGDGHV